MEIGWTDPVRNEEVLCRVQEEKKILRTLEKRKAAWICRILRRNCLQKYVIEGNIKDGV
jgi:hypothetical protein